MARKPQRASANAASVAAGLYAGKEDIAPPAGCALENEQQKTLWGQLCALRCKDDWRDFDLVLLHKLMLLECNIRNAREQLDAQGLVVKNDRGTQIANPLISVIDTFQRQQMAIIRSMSLNQTLSDPRILNKNGAKKQAIAKNASTLGSLIAQPGAQH